VPDSLGADFLLLLELELRLQMQSIEIQVKETTHARPASDRALLQTTWGE